MTRALAMSLGAIWLATGLGALGAATGLGLVKRPPPEDALDASAATMLDLLAHNAVVALWPLALVAIGWPRIPGAQVVGDVVVGGQLLVQGLLVGDAIGQQAELWRFLPHLPLEWLALAVPAGAWSAARRDLPAPSSKLAMATVALLAAAAAVETWAVPL